MPTTNAAKRVKGKRIERPFIIGSEAWPLDENNRPPDIPADHTKGWRVYVRVPEGQPDMTRWLKKVNFKIFHTYSNPLRSVESPPFEINETGWGGFTIDIRLFFAPESGYKPEYRQHFLQLEPYGDEAFQQKQRDEKLVRSEFLDYVEFNEPTEAFWDILTDDSQFTSNLKHTGGGAGGSKGKGKPTSLVPMTSANGSPLHVGGTGGIDGDKGTVELPDKGNDSIPFSKESETLIIAQLKEAEKKVSAEMTKNQTAMNEKLTRLNELRVQGAPSTAT